jgi:hypothetical protein
MEAAMTDMKAYDAQFVLDLRDLNSAIKKEFARYKRRDGFVVIIFCPEGNRYSKPISDNVNFWNCYSNEYLTILLPGYDGGTEVDDPNVYRVNLKDKTFIYSAFKGVVDAYEETTRWKYSGGCDILGFRMRVEDNQIDLDRRRAIAFNVETIDHDGKFDLNMYIAKLINNAKENFERDPLEKANQGALIALFKAILIAALPERLATFAQRYVQIDLTRPRDVHPKKDDDVHPKEEDKDQNKGAS